MTTPIVITAPEYGKAGAVFDGAPDFAFTVCGPDEAEVAAAIARVGARGVVLGVERYVGPLYAALPAGAVIAPFSLGEPSAVH